MDASRASQPGDDPATPRPLVYIVDDDVSVRESLELVACAAGWEPRLFASAEAFLASPRTSGPACLVLDVSLPALSGLDLQERMAGDSAALPIIFISGFGDVPKTVRAMKKGAVEFLVKPYAEEVLREAIADALARSRRALRDEAERAAIRARYASLTPRESEVMALVVAGRLNKQVADDLGISEITVKAHRGKMMRKMAARSLPDLVRMAGRLALG